MGCVFSSKHRDLRSDPRNLSDTGWTWVDTKVQCLWSPHSSEWMGDRDRRMSGQWWSR